MQTVSTALSHPTTNDSTTARRTNTVQGSVANGPPSDVPKDNIASEQTSSPTPSSSSQPLRPSWKLGITIILAFFATFIITMALRGTLHSPSRGFSLFANLYLAGTIIFGGGPVVIPLLREYVVNEG